MYGTAQEEAIQGSPVKSGLSKVLKSLYDMFETLVIAGAFVVFVYLFIASPHEVIGRSMEENFYNGEYLLADKVSYHFGEPRRGDVVIFKHSDTADYIKRVIGIPGDTVAVRDGSIYINGEKLEESAYLGSGVYTDPGTFLREGEEITIEKGEYFVCGDNRQHSSDSRTFGPIERVAIKGRAMIIYWPFKRLSIIDRQSYDL
jgi:signal peptidase I